MKLLKKVGLALASLGAAAPAMADDAPAMNVEMPSVKNDDGRPSLARTYDEENRSWYLSIPIIPHVSMNNVLMIGDAIDLVGGLNKLEVPEIQIEQDGSINKSGLEGFFDDLSTLPAINGNIAAMPELRFGILTKWFELHAGAYARGRADFKFKTISGDYNFDMDNNKLEFNEEQRILQALAYADLVGQGRLVIPVHIGDFILKPFVGGGYRHREALQAQVYLPKTVGSDDDVKTTEEDDIRSYGDGYFINAGIVADFSKLENRFLKPVVAVTVDNVYSQMKYKANSLNLPENDPVMLNVGLQISPFGILNLRADVLDMLNDPEYRVEAERSFGPLELAVFGRLNEKNLFGEKRHSANAYIGVVSSAVNFGLYGSIDNNSQFGAGLMMSLGWHPEMK